MPPTQTATNAARLARLLSIVLALDMFQNMLSPAVWILGASNSIVAKVSRLASYPESVAWGWLFMAALMLPFLVAQTIESNNRLCTRLACLGLCGGGALWMFMAWLGRNLDYSSLIWLFGFNCFISVAMAAVLARSINDQQKLDAGVAP